MFKVILLLTIILGSGLYFYMGFYEKIEVKEVTLLPKVILYKEYTGNYREIDKITRQLEQESKQLKVKDFRLFAMFYDDPNMLEDPNQSRVIVGILLDLSDREIAVEFLVDHSEYRINEHNSLSALSVTFPYRNSLTFAWVTLKIYPALVEYGKTNKIFTERNTLGSMEIYHYVNAEKNVEVLFPYGEGVEKLKLNTAPEPKYKKITQEL